ncbi:MAG: family 16 glycoside hydrolase [Chloroflexota bacterium]
MATVTDPQTTDFTIDVLGRYVCNGLDEALRSTDQALRPDARPFDIVIVGGGTFGAALAQHLFYLDKARAHRILVLEGGPFVLTEHVQDLPMLGLNVPGPTSIANLRASGQDGKAREQVWGLPWHANTDFPGLAYCVGGRSLFWGGWSPRLLPDETRSDAAVNPWPPATVADLNDTYFGQASEQIGVLETNDFIFGSFQNALRQQLFDGLVAGKVNEAVPLAQLPDHPAVVASTTPPTNADLLRLLGLSNNGHAPAHQDLLNLLKLEAPLAVQASTGSGFFPFNKFSSMPVLMEAARVAETECGGDDVEKRLMVVPRCHVKRLLTDGGQVTGIDTNLGYVPLPTGGVAVVALGTIESTRLALNSFGDGPHASLIGRNLMAHLRSNLAIRVPRAAIQGLDPTLTDLQAGSLFVKGEHTRANGSVAHFHFQITAAGLKRPGADSEAELFKKIPDIDTLHLFRSASRDTVVITIRGIGEMQAQNSTNRVSLDPELDEFGVPRAFVSLAPSAADLELWDAMDAAASQVAGIFAAGGVPEVISKNRDGFGTTHHEAGTLWMGDDPASSVTDGNCRFHDVANAYVASPALFPTIGSPNPMLTGIALGRRLAEHISPLPVPYAPRDGSQALFDGITPTNWHMVGPGRFIVVNGAFESIPGGADIGLLWYGVPMPADFSLKLQWMRTSSNDNSGVFIRFPDPNSKGYNNPAWVGVNFGFEVQIDEFGAPDGAGIHKTGAIYAQPDQQLSQTPALPPGQWNDFEIRAQGQTYTVLLNGAQMTVFHNPDAARGLSTTVALASYVGLQSHTGRVRFRNIGVTSLAQAPGMATRAVSEPVAAPPDVEMRR